MNFKELVLEELTTPKLKRGMKVKLPQKVINFNWHKIADPYGYIVRVQKGAVGTSFGDHNSGYAYEVECVDQMITDEINKIKSKPKRQIRLNYLKDLYKLNAKYGTNNSCWVDGKLLEDTNSALIIKQQLAPKTKEIFGDLIDEL